VAASQSLRIGRWRCGAADCIGAVLPGACALTQVCPGPAANANRFVRVGCRFRVRVIYPYSSSARRKRGMSTTLTVTSKGQVTLRKDILRHLGVAPGQKIDIEMLPDRRLESGEAVQVNRRVFRLA